METEKLNEYMFTSLVVAEARIVRRYRQHKMEAAGVNEEEIKNTPLTSEDLQKGFENIQLYRKKVSALLKAVPSDLSESPQGGH